MKVLVVTGASGGHIFPALSFIDTLKNEHSDSDILLVLPKKSIKVKVVPDICALKFISVSNIRFSFDLKNLKAVLNLIKGSLESFILLLEFKPDIVVGFGSLNSIPLLLLAWLMRIKTLIHEQNVIPGRANSLLSKFSDRVAISFAQTKDYLAVSSDRLVLTGNPIRKELKKIDRQEALNFFGFEDNLFTILVMGGSQGSQKINESFINAISAVADKLKLQVIHLAGAKDLEALNKGYKALKIKSRLLTFLDKMQYAYSIADLAITRAGATTIQELIAFSIPAVIVPYPFAYEHQRANAAVLEREGCCIVIDDTKLGPGILKQEIEAFFKDPKKPEGMRLKYSKFLKNNASEALVNTVFSLAAS